MRWLMLLFLVTPAAAESLVATRTIRPREVVQPGDILVSPAILPGALGHPDEALGLEARVAIHAGRPLRAADLGPPAIVERNQIVRLSYRTGPLNISAEGRALARAGAGEVIRVMNLASRNTVWGEVRADGTVAVGGQP